MFMKRIMITLVAAASMWLPLEASGQTIGTFRWQLSPFCNVLTLTVVLQGSFYQLVGTDDGCSGGTPIPVTGTAFQHGSGITMGLTAVSAAGGARSVSASLNLIDFNGTWSDGDDSGTFTFNPPLPATGQPLGPVERVFAHAQIRADASIRNPSSRVLSVTKLGTGIYCINFTTPPSARRLEGAQVTLGGTSAQAVFPHINNGQGEGCPIGSSLRISFFTSTGVLTDARFTFMVP
jgi:hypothetical protein